MNMYSKCNTIIRHELQVISDYKQIPIPMFTKITRTKQVRRTPCVASGLETRIKIISTDSILKQAHL